MRNLSKTSCLFAAVLLLLSPARADDAPESFDPLENASAGRLDQLLKQTDIDRTTRALEDIAHTWAKSHPQTGENLKQWLRISKAAQALGPGLREGQEDALAAAERLLRFQREALLANPAIDFEKILVVHSAEKIDFPRNWRSASSIRKNNQRDRIAVIDLRSGQGRTVYKPEKPVAVRHIDLDYSGRRILFSMPGPEDMDLSLWQIDRDGSGLECLTPEEPSPVQCYDGCWLPDGNIIFCTNANYQGVPCVGGRDQVSNLARLDVQTGRIRLLCYDQDHNWNPTVRNDGRVMYLRWEYADTPHYFTRLMMSMNPDGTNQREYYGSNSYWPNGIFFSRPIPGDPTRFVGVVTGHHDISRQGQMIVFDPAKGRKEAQGAITRIGFDKPKIEPIIADGLVGRTWPLFVHPYPIGREDDNRGAGKYFLAARRLHRESDRMGIYLVDVFDNQVLLAESKVGSLFEPIPLKSRRRPTAIPSRVDLQKDHATVYLTDVYAGDGLKGVPRGTVKQLRIFTYNYGYWRGPAGHDLIGMESSWEPKVLLGTVPVEPDGSASFRVPANLPIAVQPLDEEGAAVQLMRSWFVAQPGEFVSCTGCHENQNQAALSRTNLAAQRSPSSIQPWKGPARGFGFAREVQPVLDRYCAGCHDGSKKGRPNLADASRGPKGFSNSYHALHRYVRRGGPEDDYYVLEPMEYHAATSELVQLLKKGHHGVQLDRQSWEALYTWIDFNAPYFANWLEVSGRAARSHEIRMKLRQRYVSNPVDLEYVPELPLKRAAFKPPAANIAAAVRAVKIPQWPLKPKDVADLREKLPEPREASLVLGKDAKGGEVKLELVRIPAGKFVMGSLDGAPNERPVAVASIDRPFWMARYEITNRLYAMFDARHDSRYIDMRGKDHKVPGYRANEPDQPVIRVRWHEAQAFCDWLTERTGMRFSLPTEAQWEWACRAGSDQPMYYGTVQEDFSKLENLADASLTKMVLKSMMKIKPDPKAFETFLPKAPDIHDGHMVPAAVGSYRPNAFGLYDMHGNVCEWTRSLHRPYPYNGSDGREDPAAEGKRVVRGGSWRHRPSWATSSIRWGYEPWQAPALVGFRVVCQGPLQQASSGQEGETVD